MRPEAKRHLGALHIRAGDRVAKRPPSLRRDGNTRAPAKAWATTRTSRHARGYGWAWEQLRARVLTNEPLCRICADTGRAVLAVTVDHIKPKAIGGGDEETNLQPLCDPCHRAKTARDAALRR